MEDIGNGAFIFCDAKINKYGPQNVCPFINGFIKKEKDNKTFI